MADKDPTKKTDDGTKTLKDDPAFQALAGIVKELGKSVQSMQTNQSALSEDLKKTLDVIKAGGGDPNKSKSTQKEVSEDELNEMSQAQLVQHIFGGMRKMLDSTSGDLKKQLESVSTSVSNTDLKSELREFARTHKDLGDWQEEIVNKLKEKPGLTVQDAYTLARAGNPEKATELDEKYADKPTKQDERPRFGGITPTSGIVDMDTDDKEKEGRLSAKEASEKAFDEIFGDHPELVGEDSM